MNIICSLRYDVQCKIKNYNYNHVSSYLVSLHLLQIVMELPIEHGLLLDNLLDLAHAPFTHTSTFAKGWSVPRFVWFILF